MSWTQEGPKVDATGDDNFSVATPIMDQAQAGFDWEAIQTLSKKSTNNDDNEPCDHHHDVLWFPWIHRPADDFADFDNGNEDENDSHAAETGNKEEDLLPIFPDLLEHNEDDDDWLFGEEGAGARSKRGLWLRPRSRPLPMPVHEDAWFFLPIMDDREENEVEPGVLLPRLDSNLSNHNSNQGTLFLRMKTNVYGPSPVFDPNC